jgi:hypothetical protein
MTARFAPHPGIGPRVLRAAAIALLMSAAACKSPEDRIAGRYERVWREGVTPERGFGNGPDRHVLILTADRTWTSEHPAQAIQQFDVPSGHGTYALNGVTLMLGPTEIGSMQYTISGDTLFPRTPPGVRQMEKMTGASMNIGVDTYLLRER